MDTINSNSILNSKFPRNSVIANNEMANHEFFSIPKDMDQQCIVNNYNQDLLMNDDTLIEILKLSIVLSDGAA